MSIKEKFFTNLQRIHLDYYSILAIDHVLLTYSIHFTKAQATYFSMKMHKILMHIEYILYL